MTFLCMTKLKVLRVFYTGFLTQRRVINIKTQRGVINLKTQRDVINIKTQRGVA